MRRIIGAISGVAVVLSLIVLMPAIALAEENQCVDSLAKCTWDPMKWEENQNSWNLY